MNRLAIVGCGRLGNIVAGAVANGFLPEYELVGAYSRSYEKAAGLAAEFSGSCTACRTLSELFDLEPDYIVETASPAAMRELAIPALEKGISIVTLSIGAFADDDPDQHGVADTGGGRRRSGAGGADRTVDY